MRNLRYRFMFLFILLCVCFYFWKTVDAKTVSYSNSALDIELCSRHVTSVSYKTCMDIFESKKYSSNVMVYNRRFLLCSLCYVSEGLNINKTPGSIVVHDPSADTTLTNLALGKPSSQSSTFSDAVSSIAVDGIWDSNMNPRPYKCTNTNTNQDSQDNWWMVDLEDIYQISILVILNRGDCCWERLRDLTVTVGETIDSMLLCNKFEGPGGIGKRETITCRNPLVGQFVRISKPATEPLQLCEVAVYS